MTSVGPASQANAAHGKPAKGEARRRLILESTLRVIADEGLDAVTHRRVAEVAGIGFSSVTYWFDTRAALIRAAFQSYLDAVDTFVADLRSAGGAASIAELVDALVEMERRSFEDPMLVVAEYELLVAAARDRDLAEAYLAWEHDILGGMAASLEALGAPRPFESARTVLHVLRGAELDRLVRPGADDADLRRRLTTILTALCPPAPDGGPRAHHASARQR